MTTVTNLTECTVVADGRKQIVAVPELQAMLLRDQDFYDRFGNHILIAADNEPLVSIGVGGGDRHRCTVCPGRAEPSGDCPNVIITDNWPEAVHAIVAVINERLKPVEGQDG